MKTDTFRSLKTRKSREGSSVLIILVLLVIMVALVAANNATLNRLRQRVKLLDQRQTQRLASFSTNAVSAAAPTVNPPNSK